MNKSIELIKKGFESSSQLTPEFAAFFRTFKSEFSKELKSVEATNIVFSRGHFYLSGFFTKDNKVFYFSISDVRGICPIPFVEGFAMLYRTAKDYKDYTGGSNQWITIEKGMADKMRL